MLLSLQGNDTFHVQNQCIDVSYITIHDYCDLQISGIVAFAGHLIDEIEVGVSHLQSQRKNSPRPRSKSGKRPMLLSLHENHAFHVSGLLSRRPWSGLCGI